MRLVEVRLLDGPNVYRLEPTVKLEVMVGRRRTWYGQRLPGRHSVVHIGRAVAKGDAPPPVRDISAWVTRLHTLTGAAGWLRVDRPPSADPHPRARIGVRIHRGSDPGHWVVSFPWRERGRAGAIAEAAYALSEAGLDARETRVGGASGGGSRRLSRALATIGEADRDPPSWIRDEERQVPVVSISGTNGKSTTTRMITHILRSTGRLVGTSTSDGVLIDEQLVEAGDLTGPMGAQHVLADPRVEVAVLETARGGLLLRGMGYESNEAAVLTNITSDHMDLHGLHTLPELAEVKATIARITRADGTVVLNAEDALLAALASGLGARVCWFALEPHADPASRRIRRHLARGGRAMVLDDGWLVEWDAEARRPIVEASDVPATLGGLARHNVANALAAAGAARALGISIADAARGLRTYTPTVDLAPGRMNLYLRGRRLVIVDFAHNEAGLTAALDVAEGVAGARPARRASVSVIMGTAGDRPDDTLRGIGRIAAARADDVAIKETLSYLRGRTRESVVGELLVGARESGMAARDVPVYGDEPAAVRGELTTLGRAAATEGPAVLLVMCHADRPGVEAVLADLGFAPLDPARLGHLASVLDDGG